MQVPKMSPFRLSNQPIFIKRSLVIVTSCHKCSCCSSKICSTMILKQVTAYPKC
uniref:Uncharacterized protein MANES_18G106800 n=1 Tax=Rhizophora mucronata TaxID=61149 RepID=A0A2P2IQ53_RHIMU